MLRRDPVLQELNRRAVAERGVENSLVDQAKTREQVAAQRRQVEALGRYAYLARLRYDNGYTSYIEVLDAERSLFQSQLQLSQTQGQLFSALINLYKALGGGWVGEADQEKVSGTLFFGQ